MKVRTGRVLTGPGRPETEPRKHLDRSFGTRYASPHNLGHSAAAWQPVVERARETRQRITRARVAAWPTEKAARSLARLVASFGFGVTTRPPPCRSTFRASCSSFSSLGRPWTTSRSLPQRTMKSAFEGKGGRGKSEEREAPEDEREHAGVPLKRRSRA